MDLHHYFSELSEASWSVLPVEPNIAKNLLKSAQTKEAQFKKAGINHDGLENSQFRNDRIFWLDTGNHLADCERQLMEDLNHLRQGLRDYFRISIKEFECHYSIYESGQFYARHRDTLKQNNKRVFSFVLYLNPEWSEKDGGQIIGYDQEQILFKIQPLAGQLLLFKSEVEHEVVPAQRSRYALTGWMRL